MRKGGKLEGWKVEKIGDVCEVVAGQSPEGKYYNNKGNGMPFYQGKKDFTEKFLGEPTTWTTNTTKEAQQGDILMSVRAPVGPVNFAIGKICIGRGLAAIRASKLIDKEFLFYFFLKHESEIVGNAGAVFSSINKAQIESIELPLPPLPEQQRIVHVLDEAFASIAQAKSNAERNLVNARELFGSYLESLFADSRSGWEEKKLGEVCERITDGTHVTPKYVPEGVPFLSVKNLTKGFIDFSDTRFITPEEHAILTKRVRPERDDVLYTKVGTTGVAKVVDVDVEFSIFVSIALLKLKHEMIFNRYLEFFLNSPFARKQAQQRTRGTANKNLVITDIKEIEIHYPKSLAEQRAIVGRLEALSAETGRLEEIYEAKVEGLEELKRSVLGKAFGGEL